MTAPPHLLSRVDTARGHLRDMLAEHARYPGQVADAVADLIVAHLDVLCSELGRPTSDEREDAARAEEAQAIREGVEVAEALMEDTSLAFGSDRAKLARAVILLAKGRK